MPLGSSPLARGGPHSTSLATSTEGLIPARAGRTGQRGPSPPRGWAHPRSRGADLNPGTPNVPHGGSSPLARGGLAGDRGRVEGAGLIPARAGRTRTRTEATNTPPAHPRSRGADTTAPHFVHVHEGSSRSRGADVPAQCAAALRAGSSPLARGGPPPSCPSAAPTEAHPRSRGADSVTRDNVAGYQGSSPLARGGLSIENAEDRVCRLIPARAGRTARLPRPVPLAPAHPRSRGADLVDEHDDVDNAGSSPLARGGRPHRARRRNRPGLIPARAGRTPAWIRCGSSTRAHPRSRGADSSPFSGGWLMLGSSPLARGGRMKGLDLLPIDWLIPARAGRTS